MKISPAIKYKQCMRQVEKCSTTVNISTVSMPTDSKNSL